MSKLYPQPTRFSKEPISPYANLSAVSAVTDE